MLGIERERERKKKHVPIVSHDVDPRTPGRQGPKENVYVEPARTHRIDGRLPESTVRGTLYESDMRRPRREYRIEERMPNRIQSSQDREWKEKEREERRERRRKEREWRESGR